MAGHIRAFPFPLLCILYEGLTETLLDLFPFFAAILSSRRLQIPFEPVIQKFCLPQTWIMLHDFVTSHSLTDFSRGEKAIIRWIIHRLFVVCVMNLMKWCWFLWKRIQNFFVEWAFNHHKGDKVWTMNAFSTMSKSFPLRCTHVSC
jgi:hypothetical protein